MLSSPVVRNTAQICTVLLLLAVFLGCQCTGNCPCDPQCAADQTCNNGTCVGGTTPPGTPPPSTTTLVDVILISEECDNQISLRGPGCEVPINFVEGGCQTTDTGVNSQDADDFTPLVGKDVIVTVTGLVSTNSRPQVRVFTGSGDGTAFALNGPFGGPETATTAFQPTNAGVFHVEINECNPSQAPAGSSYHILVTQAN